MHRIKKFRLLAILCITSLLLIQGCTQSLRVASHTELKVIDPIWTTSYITRNHGYLVYDTLFSMNEMFEPEPQMVDSWTVSADKKTWEFKLREGLNWHDGSKVTAEDCIASLKRWGQRDGEGQLLIKNIESLTAVDSSTFVMKLRKGNELIPNIFAKISTNVPFMMPKHIAETDAFTEIKDPMGSGPYVFKMDEWVPGKKAVYLKNKSYVPRQEPASLMSGGKLAKLDRIEWVVFPSQKEAVDALILGDVDYIESPSTKMIPLVEGKKGIEVGFNDPLGNIAMIRFNTLLPPFDNVDVRRAVVTAINQKDYMTEAMGDQKFWRTCYSVFACDTEFESDAGNAIMKKGDFKAAKSALKKANYDGTPVVILNPTDSPTISAFTKVTAEKLRQIGMSVNVQNMTWAELTERRASQDTAKNGGWNIFHTWWIAEDMSNPMSIVFSGNGTKGWYGWPEDQKLEQYRADYVQATNRKSQKDLADKIQTRLYEIGALGILGQFFEPVIYRTQLKGVSAPVPLFGNMSFEKDED